MNYREAIDFLFSNLPMYQRVGKAAYKSNLNNTQALDRYFGHPHKNFCSIHIAGTNGKGSVSHMLASVLQASGFRTGLYTSPHLKDFRERIRVDGEMIPEENVTAFVRDHKDILDQIHPSFFEMTVAMAFEHFSREGVEMAVIETGMGGRLDSTNIISPVITVITNIGRDHCQFLGDTLEKIAGEKAGIMKPGVPLVIGESQQETAAVFRERSEALGCSLYYADKDFQVDYSTMDMASRQIMQVYREGEAWLENLEVDLLGMYQRKNVITSLAVIELLKRSGQWTLEEKDVKAGFARITSRTGFRGRWEIMDYNPLIVCDTAHNPEGIREVVEQIRQTPWKNLHIVMGFVDDKEPEEVLQQFPREASYYFTEASMPRAMDKEKLAMEALKLGIHGQVCISPVSALVDARKKAGPDDMIFVGGSTFIVAEIL